MNSSTKTDIVLPIALILCFSFLAWAFAVTNNDTIKTTIITAVIATLGILVNWRYGSSKSSANKDETIKALQEDKNKSVIGDTVDTQNITVENKTQQ